MKLGNVILASVLTAGCASTKPTPRSVECSRAQISAEVQEVCSNKDVTGFDMQYLRNASVKNDIVFAEGYAGHYVNCSGVFALPDNLEDFDICLMTNF